jgi:predicted amidohydrolase YtcJ
VLATQAHVASGSDWPVSSANPLEGIEVGVTRRAPGDSTSAAWIEQECVSLPAMVRSYTLGAAYANFEEVVSGSIQVGKWADLIVLDRDIFELQEHEIHTAQVVRTLLEGRTIWQAKP